MVLRKRRLRKFIGKKRERAIYLEDRLTAELLRIVATGQGLEIANASRRANTYDCVHFHHD